MVVLWKLNNQTWGKCRFGYHTHYTAYTHAHTRTWTCTHTHTHRGKNEVLQCCQSWLKIKWITFREDLNLGSVMLSINLAKGVALRLTWGPCLSVRPWRTGEAVFSDVGGNTEGTIIRLHISKGVSLDEKKKRKKVKRKEKRFHQDLNSDHWREGANHYTTELPDKQSI